MHSATYGCATQVIIFVLAVYLLSPRSSQLSTLRTQWAAAPRIPRIPVQLSRAARKPSIPQRWFSQPADGADTSQNPGKTLLDVPPGFDWRAYVDYYPQDSRTRAEAEAHYVQHAAVNGSRIHQRIRVLMKYHIEGGCANQVCCASIRARKSLGCEVYVEHR